MSKHLLYLRRSWIGTNASQMLTAVGNKQLDSYLFLRKKVVDQIHEFDAELGLAPFLNDVKKCECCESMTLNKSLKKSDLV